MNIPSTVDRTPQHTAAHVNREIRYRTEQSIARCAAAGHDSINNRLDELDEEWDVERTLEATAASSFLLALLLGASAGWFWHFVAAVIAVFLLLHAVQGWCPPVALFRQCGFRTASEIDYERYALKSIRGDFDALVAQGPATAEQLVETMRR
ncbi:MAG: hypothetical protein JWP89_1051 [Schlesneria sp.]|nr:hypothetical protein [Schlesneria sp.]